MRPTTTALALGIALAACKASPEKGPRSERAAATTSASAARSNDATPRPAAVPPFPGAAAPADAAATPSGVRYRVLRQGRRDPTLSGVVADLSVWTEDGKLALTTLDKQPSSFQLAFLPAELGNVVGALGVGGSGVFWLPRTALEPWAPPAIPRANVVVHLDVRSPLEAPKTSTTELGGPSLGGAPAPESGAPPPDSTRTPSGLRYVTLVRGRGAKPLAPSQPVTARVDAWAQNGIALERVISGIQINTTPERAPGGLGEVMTRVLPGSRTRIWVPARSSAAILPDRQERDLILDIELVNRE